MTPKCGDDPIFRKMLNGYCAYIRQCFDFAEVNIQYSMIKRRREGRKFALVMDFDGVFMGEGVDCLNDEMFSCTVAFVRYIHQTYGTSLPIYIITARTRAKGVLTAIKQIGMHVGPHDHCHIRAVFCDEKQLGTAESKIRNRDKVRADGFDILCTIGDNVLDLQTEDETDGYADTINVLLPNIWRHRSLRALDE